MAESQHANDSTEPGAEQFDDSVEGTHKEFCEKKMKAHEQWKEQWAKRKEEYVRASGVSMKARRIAEPAAAAQPSSAAAAASQSQQQGAPGTHAEPDEQDTPCWTAEPDGDRGAAPLQQPQGSEGAIVVDSESENEGAAAPDDGAAVPDDGAAYAVRVVLPPQPPDLWRGISRAQHELEMALHNFPPATQTQGELDFDEGPEDQVADAPSALGDSQLHAGTQLDFESDTQPHLN